MHDERLDEAPLKPMGTCVHKRAHPAGIATRIREEIDPVNKRCSETIGYDELPPKANRKIHELELLDLAILVMLGTLEFAPVCDY